MKILIIGGNRYFGKEIVENLLRENHEITLLNRGSIEDGFGSRVNRIQCDRNNKNLFEEKLANTKWDVVIDQACFDYQQAKHAAQVIQTNRYLFTSSQSVYKEGSYIKEDCFDSDYQFQSEVPTNQDYGEAKRQAEAAFLKHSSKNIVFIRPPIVLGFEDYTKRLKFHIDKIKKGEEIYFPDINARISFVHSSFLAKAIAKLVTHSFTGAINIANPESLKLSELVKMIEASVGRKIKLAERRSDSNMSPYGINSDWFMDCSLMESVVGKPESLLSWIPDLIDQLKAEA